MIRNLEQLQEKGIENNVIYNCDCIDAMAMVPDNYFDLCYADPPFNAKSHIGKYNKGYDICKDNKTPAEYKKWCRLWFKQARRISKKLIITPGVANQFNYPAPRWVWIVSKPSGNAYHVFGGLNVYECMSIYDKPIKKVIRDVIMFDAMNFCRDGANEHPCPDSIKMCKWILDNWSLPGEKVLVPFSGSGQMELACMDLGRIYVGIEISKKYCELAACRIGSNTPQLNL